MEWKAAFKKLSSAVVLFKFGLTDIVNAIPTFHMPVAIRRNNKSHSLRGAPSVATVTNRSNLSSINEATGAGSFMSCMDFQNLKVRIAGIVCPAPSAAAMIDGHV